MTRVIFLLAQAAENLPLRSFWDIALQFGMAGAVLVVVFLFLAYNERRDIRDANSRKTDQETMGKLANSLDGVKESINRLDTHIRMVAAVKSPRDQV